MTSETFEKRYQQSQVGFAISDATYESRAHASKIPYVSFKFRGGGVLDDVRNVQLIQFKTTR